MKKGQNNNNKNNDYNDYNDCNDYNDNKNKHNTNNNAKHTRAGNTRKLHYLVHSTRPQGKFTQND